jgi:hypothetical protein
MRKLHGLLALALLGASSAALSQTTLPLNTGFNHSNFTVYTPPPLTDNYWIKVGGSNGNGPFNVPAFVINKHALWANPLSGGGFGSQWIGATSPTGASTSSQVNYAIYRKCFCLMPGFKKAEMNFKILGDDMIGVWLNGINNNIVPVQGGSFTGPAINGPVTAPQFQTGRNCIYVLVVDTGSVVTGFDLAGTVTAYGLMPMAAAGSNMSFKPCQCEGPVKAVADDRATIQAIARIAADRRTIEPGPRRD